jgi:hypothetical protein
MTDKKHDEHAEVAKPTPKPATHTPEEMEKLRNTDPQFIEKTRPEDPSGRPGQLTRDNVNPNIPSGKQGDPPGPIVDPNSLGMEQGGVASTSPMKPETPIAGQPQPKPVAAPAHDDEEKKKGHKNDHR